tara:strand:- start:1320 stop:1451 length:132 start_codon:yes stop_codon:yes gene_type:complete
MPHAAVPVQMICHPFSREVAPPGLPITTTFRALSLSRNGLPSD